MYLPETAAIFISELHNGTHKKREIIPVCPSKEARRSLDLMITTTKFLITTVSSLWRSSFFQVCARSCLFWRAMASDLHVRPSVR